MTLDATMGIRFTWYVVLVQEPCRHRGTRSLASTTTFFLSWTPVNNVAQQSASCLFKTEAVRGTGLKWEDQLPE